MGMTGTDGRGPRLVKHMDCADLTIRLTDRWAATLTAEAEADLEAHLAGCQRCRDEARALTDTWNGLGGIPDEEPSPAMRLRFEAMLDAWREGQRDATVVPFAPPARPVAAGPRHWWGLAAAAVVLVAAGFGAGRLAGGQSAATSAELAALRTEVRGMQQMVALSLLQQQSATERLRGVSWSHQMDRPGAEVIAALVDTLRSDGNVNVRLAAVDALRQFADAQEVRGALVDALGRQESPLVQIALIDTMVELRERRSIDALRTLAANGKANEVVRQRASWGLQRIG